MGRMLDIHEEWSKNMTMYCSGLCNATIITANDWDGIPIHLFDIISPTSEDLAELEKEGLNVAYWGSGSHERKKYVYTPLRQTLVLLMAAINGEFD